MAEPVAVIPGARAVELLRNRLAELANQVNEKFRVDEQFECGTFPCELGPLVRDLNLRFGRTLVGLYGFGLVDRLDEEFTVLVSPVLARGAGDGFPGAVLDAWLMALRTALESRAQEELAAPLARLRANLRSSRPGEPGPLAGPVKEFLDLILARQRRHAVEVALERFRHQGPVERVFDETVLPALARVGELWQMNRVSAADEHAASEICRYVVLRLLDSVEPRTPNGRRALVACAPGEEHELGAEVVAGLLELHGWEAFFVGRSAPQDEILKSAEASRPCAVLLSATMVASLPALRELALALRTRLPEAKLVAGGRSAVLAADALAGVVDAVAASAAEGCDAATRLAG